MFYQLTVDYYLIPLFNVVVLIYLLYLMDLFFGPRCLSLPYQPPCLQVEAQEVAKNRTNKERNIILESFRSWIICTSLL